MRTRLVVTALLITLVSVSASAQDANTVVTNTSKARSLISTIWP